MKHMKFEKGFFERTAGENAFQRMGYELLPPPAGGGRSSNPLLLRRISFSSDTYRTYEAHEAYEAYEAQEPIFGKTADFDGGWNCNCEMYLQRLDAFATVGCIAAV